MTLEDRLNTVAGLRYRMESALPEDRMGYWKAEHEDELVGWAYAGINTFAPTDTAGFGGITVAPSHRRSGVGSALWEALLAHVEAIGVRRLVATSRADADSVEFPRRRGFTRAATQTSLAVDPRTIVAPSAPPGVELRPFSAYADAPESVYEVDREAILDEPGPNDLSGVTFETWRRHHWDYPDCDRELGLVAVVDGKLVGMTFLLTDRLNGLALNGGTGVSRAFRGRGLGLLMKQYSLAAAAQAGIVRVITQNDDTNAPMLSINERLGYRPFSVGHSWVLER